MNVASVQSTGSGGAVSEANVRLQKGQSDQHEAVIAKLIDSVEAMPRAPEQSGGKLNISA